MLGNLSEDLSCGSCAWYESLQIKSIIVPYHSYEWLSFKSLSKDSKKHSCAVFINSSHFIGYISIFYSISEEPPNRGFSGHNSVVFLHIISVSSALFSTTGNYCSVAFI